jgi:isopentenyl-diphosphate delta-isomerase
MEQVVLVDEEGHARGVMEKSAVHHANTPLHLGFSCYVLNNEDQLLLTRRALGKKTWPGVWTNSCCGHPHPGESLVRSVQRRLGQELGIGTADITLILPGFRYAARMDNGVREHEWCPVFRAYTVAEPAPDPAEVAETRWIAWPAFSEEVASGALTVSPWCALQVPQLAALGPDPRRWPTGDAAALPAAARLVEQTF